MGGELKTYEVEVSGNKTTMQLNERDAKRLGVLDGGDTEDAQQDETLVTSSKTRTATNKARTAENK